MYDVSQGADNSTQLWQPPALPPPPAPKKRGWVIAAIVGIVVMVAAGGSLAYVALFKHHDPYRGVYTSEQMTASMRRHSEKVIRRSGIPGAHIDEVLCVAKPKPNLFDCHVSWSVPGYPEQNITNHVVVQPDGQWVSH